MGRGLSKQQTQILGLAFSIREAVNGYSIAHYSLGQGLYWLGGVPFAGGYTYRQTRHGMLEVANPGLFVRTREVKVMRASLSRACSSLIKRGLLEWTRGREWYCNGYTLTEAGSAVGQLNKCNVDLETAVAIQIGHDPAKRGDRLRNYVDAVLAEIQATGSTETHAGGETR
jgi:hypothetical protein